MMRGWSLTRLHRTPPQEMPRARQEPDPRRGRRPAPPSSPSTTYDVALDLTTGPTTFRDAARTVRFTALREGAEHLHRPHRAPPSSTITLNGRVARPGHALRRRPGPAPGLRRPTTSSTVDATGAYMNTGEGLHRFVDPVDDEVYLYSPVRGRRLPAHVRRVRAARPQGHATPSRSPRPRTGRSCPTPPRRPSADGRARDRRRERHATWRFAPTPRDVLLHHRARRRPVRRRPRRGPDPQGRRPAGHLLPQVADASTSTPTTSSTAPSAASRSSRRSSTARTRSTKYDQLFTPSTTWARWRTPGRVTFNEIYVFRAKVTEAIIERRALTILHELAHMWFGNLVTMQWWDDLWLNESFAEWASTTLPGRGHPVGRPRGPRSAPPRRPGPTARTSSPRPTRSSPTSATSRTSRSTSTASPTPRAPRCSSSSSPTSAASRSSPALRAYFAKHAWGNTTLADLLDELESASGRDLRAWSELWLETAGRQHPAPRRRGRRPTGVITAAAIEQTAAEAYPTLRPHRLAIGSYDVRDGDRLVRVDRSSSTSTASAPRCPQLVGQRQPDLLLVNDDDLAYAKIRLDERSLGHRARAPAGVHQQRCPAARPRRGVGHDPRRRDVGAGDFVDLVLDALPARPTRPSCASCSASCRPPRPVRRPRAPRRDPASLDARRPAGAGHRGRARQRRAAAARQRVRRATPAATRTWPGCAPCSRAAPCSTASRSTPSCAGPCSPALAAAGAAAASEIEAERQRRQHRDRSRARRPGAGGASPRPRPRPRPGHQVVEQEGLPNQTVDAIAQGFVRVHDTALLRPYVESTTRCSTTLWASRTARDRRVGRRGLLSGDVGQPRAARRAPRPGSTPTPRPLRPCAGLCRRTATVWPGLSGPGAGRAARLSQPAILAPGSADDRGALGLGTPDDPSPQPDEEQQRARRRAQVEVIRSSSSTGLPSAPASGSRQFGYSSSVPGWFIARRSPVRSGTATPSSRARRPRQEPVQGLHDLPLGGAAAQQAALDQHVEDRLASRLVDLALLLDGAGQQAEAIDAGRCARRPGSRRSAAGRGWSRWPGTARDRPPAAAAGRRRPSRTTGSTCRGCRARAGSHAPTARRRRGPRRPRARRPDGPRARGCRSAPRGRSARRCPRWRAGPRGPTTAGTAR